MMNTQNNNFINKICELCGENDTALSEIRLTCNYGSQNNGEQITLDICGDCADEIYNYLCRKGDDTNKQNYDCGQPNGQW